MPGHRFAIGQSVRLMKKFGFSPKSAEVYTVTQQLPEQGGLLQYRIRNDYERHERAAAEDDLEEIGSDTG